MKSSLKALVFNTIACLSMAGFFMYSVQEIALSKMEGGICHHFDILEYFIFLESFRSHIYQPPILSAFSLIQAGSQEDPVEGEEPERRVAKVWVTMGRYSASMSLYALCT